MRSSRALGLRVLQGASAAVGEKPYSNILSQNFARFRGCSMKSLVIAVCKGDLPFCGLLAEIIEP
jgi:hypothetical protein